MIRRALTNTGWLMGARGFNAVLSLIYLAVATRTLGLEGFGQFILIVTFAQVLVGLVSFQTWQIVVHWGQRKETLADATGFAIALDILTIVVGLILAALLLEYGGDWLPIPVELRWPAFFFVVASFFGIRSTPTGILRLHDRFGRAAVSDTVIAIVRVIGCGVVLLTQASIPAFLLIWGVAELATAAAFWIMAMRTQPLYLSHTSLTRIPRTQDRVWPFVIGTSLSGTLSVASRQFLILLVGALGGASLAGIYRVAAQIGEGLLKLAQALLRATYPELVRSPEAARAMAGRIALIGVSTGVVSVLMSALVGHWIIEIIAGDEYLAAYYPMIVLSAAAALELSGASFEALLVARGKALLNFVLRAVPTALALAALPWLVEWWGATGAAFAVLAASALTVAGFMLANRQRESHGPA